MSEIRDRLTKLRQQEQETRGYGTSSAWYTALRPAISYLELAETATNSAEKFRNAWSAVYNLSMMMHRRGEIENVTFTRLTAEVEAAPKVRSIALATPTAFLEALKRAQTTLLFDAESKKPRESKQLVEIWLDRRKKRGDISPEKACTYLFLIGRDLRNALSHPKLDPNSPVIKRALVQAADIFVPLAIATTEAIIERPPEGTTGRVIAYRSFLYPFLKNSDSPFSDYYLERLFPEQELSAFPELEAREDVKAINRELETVRGELVQADADETLQRWCIPVLFHKLGLAVDNEVRIVADDGVFEPTAVIKKAELQGRPRHEYKSKDAGRDLACLIWVLPWSVSLDTVSRDEQFEALTMLEVAQRGLSRADVDWAILTNGQQVRLLSKTTSHKARSFMEIDLVAIVERRGEREAQLAFRYLLGLCSQASIVERDAQGHTRLERALRESERHGREISKELKENVFTALEKLGKGFLAYLQSQPAELDAWRVQRAPSLSAEKFLVSQELLTDIYQESLSLMYRLLFLFYAEGRDLLPMDEELYRDTYSLESIRDDIIVTHDDPSPTSFFSNGAFNLWSRLKELFDAVDGGWRNIIPAYNGGLFDSEQHQFLERFKINDNQLASAIDLLSRTKPGAARGEGRKKVTYRDLDIRHLGSIYEGILEYHAEMADQEKVVIKRGASGKSTEEYVNLSELKAEERPHLKAYRQALKEDEEHPSPPRGCKVTGLIELGEYYLISGGRESKRKSSGSYYTPDFIVQYIVENALGSLLRGECRPKVDADKSTDGEREFRPLTSEEILELKVLDPAMGSGHFLVAATEYLARAYGTACIREGKDKDGAMSDHEFVHYKRIIAERCIYGVDINLMAVELSKLSMWLFTMDKGRPLSFLNHHLKCGNALIGARIKDLGAPPEFDNKGKLKRKPRRDARTGNLFEVRFREMVPVMVRDLLAITQTETLTIADVRAKKALDNAVDEIKRPFRNVADIWVGLYFGEEADDYNSLLLDVNQARSRGSDKATGAKAFHWELEFPEVSFDVHGNRRDDRGFDAIIGNPPYLRIQGLQANFDKHLDYYISQYRSAVKRFDLYLLFAERGFDLLAERGRLCIICPHKFINSDFGSGLRQFLKDNLAIESIVSFGNNLIFDQAAAYTGVLLLQKRRSESFAYYEFPSVPISEMSSRLSELTKEDFARFDVCGLSSAPWVLTSSDIQIVLGKLSRQTETLKDVFDNILVGVQSGIDDIYVLKAVSEPSGGIISLFSERANANVSIERELVKPFLRGEDVHRYAEPQHSYYCIYPYQLINGKTKILEESELKARFPLGYAYLRTYRAELTEIRIRQATNPVYWYSCHRSRDMQVFECDRIITPEISLGCNMTFATGGVYHNTMAYSLLASRSFSESNFYWLALLNSRLLWWFLSNTGTALRGGYFRFKTNYLNPFPVRTINLSDTSDKARHDQIVELVKEELRLHSEAVKSKGGQAAVKDRIATTDRQIDQLVYELYGLTYKEIEIIEASSRQLPLAL
jgi:type I restriction-modification system DNA methylase subunit